MPLTTVWNIHQPDGRYLGQSSGLAPHIAFCRYMALIGTKVAESEVEYEITDENSGRITYRSEVFVLARQN